MNARVLLHVAQAMLAAVTAGTVIVPAVPDDVWKSVVAVCGLLGIGIAAYLAATTTGLRKGQ